MPPTSKNLEGHIALGLSVRSFVRPYAFGISHIFGTMHARILKFNKCIAYEKLVDLYFLSLCQILHSGVTSLFSHFSK